MVEMAKKSPEPFRSYHCLSGTYSHDQRLLAAFDLNHFSWRVLTQANATNAETLVKNGTWINTRTLHPHAAFPELNLQITNLHPFGKKLCLPTLCNRIQD
jgi:hypothetical protein